MVALAVITTGVLLILAVIHLLWAMEIWWPIREEGHLVSTVVGFRGVTRMPGAIPCIGVALALSSAAVMIWLPDTWPRAAGLMVLSVVFGGRAVLAYVPMWRRLTPQQPFARYDQMFYGPLCAYFAIACFVLRGWT